MTFALPEAFLVSGKTEKIAGLSLLEVISTYADTMTPHIR